MENTNAPLPLTDNTFASPNYVETTPEVKSLDSKDFTMLTPEAPELPDLNSSPLIPEPVSNNANAITPGTTDIGIENAPNANIKQTNNLTMEQEKTKTKDSAMASKSSPAPVSPPSNPPSSGGMNSSGGMGNVINIKNMTTFEKVAMETAFLPLWRSFNA
jgi:hypothetical protein